MINHIKITIVSLKNKVSSVLKKTEGVPITSFYKNVGGNKIWFLYNIFLKILYLDKGQIRSDIDIMDCFTDKQKLGFVIFNILYIVIDLNWDTIEDEFDDFLEKHPNNSFLNTCEDVGRTTREYLTFSKHNK